jgi:Uma2 family endonuclease
MPVMGIMPFMALPATKHSVTVDEYLRAEAASDIKHEFHDGEVLAMSGGTYDHSVIIANLIQHLGNHLTGSRCRVLDSNMRIRITPGNYVYPDASVVCGPPQFDPQDPNRTTILNPRVVIEVLSASIEGYDRGGKFTQYREIFGLEEYVLVAQDRPLVETFVRQPESGWLMLPTSGIDSTAAIRSLKIELPLQAIYADVTFGRPTAG